MAETTDASTQTAERELVITRVFDAPRELVWKAWTDREMGLQWAGPKGFTAVDFELDARRGGTWHLTMRSADGNELTNRGVVREAVEPERLVFTFAWDNDDGTPGREMLITIDFANVGGKAEMTFRQGAFDSVEDRDGHIEGWNESFDKLEAYLASA
jgi:uncharacterized protein YndB with AHSA1/START domain